MQLFFWIGIQIDKKYIFFQKFSKIKINHSHFKNQHYEKFKDIFISPCHDYLFGNNGARSNRIWGRF